MKLKYLKQKKLILVKLIGIGNNESKRINNNKDEDDSIKKIINIMKINVIIMIMTMMIMTIEKLSVLM